MKYVTLISLFLLCQICCFSQNVYEDLSSRSRLENTLITESLPQVFASDLIFYGFIHGAALPQKTDAKILIELLDKGVQYYAPEVSSTGAFFLNKYLETGNEDFLIYVLSKYAAPQDASIQWIEKYRTIYKYLQGSNKSLTIIGTDIERNNNLLITHLAHLLNDRKTGNAMVDSLSLFKSLEPSQKIISGKPVGILMEQYDLSWTEVLYPKESQYHFTARFLEYYESNKEVVLEAFGKDGMEVKMILDPWFDEELVRELFIFENFKRSVIPLIRKGEKVYSNFGYAHVLQAKLNNRLYLAGLLKEAFPDIKIYSILTHLADSEVLKNKKYCKTGIMDKLGQKIKMATICGSTKSKKWDGDTNKEKVRGIDELRSITKMGELRVFDIQSLPKNLREQQYFIGYEEGKNAGNLQFESNLTTDDYFQGLIFIRGSEANETFEVIDAMGDK